MRLSRRLAALATLVFFVVLVRTAWVSDDAVISLRTVMNVTHGFGLTFNPVERVQTFTHPLWVMLITLSYILIRNIYFATFAVTFTVSIAVFWLAVRGAREPWRAWLAAALLVSSHAFIDYSTPGLENPLSCLLLALLVSVAFAPAMEPPRAAVWGWLLLALLYLTRPDDVVLALPLVVVLTLRLRRWTDRARAAAMGLVPAAVWTLFAIVYYGFPFPNTAYAKLGTGISRSETITQGFLYIVESLDRDPLTLTVTVVAIGLALAVGTAIGRALAAGLVLHLIYVAWIGGDFMSGRFLSVPFYLSVLIVTRLAFGTLRQWAPALVVLGIVALSAGQLPIRMDSTMVVAHPKRNGIAFERGLYFGNSSLVQAGRWSFREPEWPHAGDGVRPLEVFQTCGLLGDAGIKRGPHSFIVDECALADPLLARLPAQFNEQWRVGHFRRWIPAGYLRSVEGNANHLEDRNLAAYYDQLRLATRGSMWSGARWRAIAGLNTGRFDHLIDRRYYRFGTQLFPLAEFADVKGDGTPWDTVGNHAIPAVGGLAISCDDKPGRRYLDVSLDSDDRYRLIFIKKNRILSEMDFGPIPEHRRRLGLTSYTGNIPPRARTQGFDTVLVVALEGDNNYAIGHLLLEGQMATDPELHRRVAIRDGLASK